MNNNLSEIRQKLNEEKNKMGLVGGSIQIVEYDETEHPLAAHISPHGWDIQMTLRKGFEPISDKRQKAYARVKKITNGLETLLFGIFTHECAHWQLPYGSELGCPYDLHHHDKILEGVERGLPEEKKGMAGYAANAFEDMIINPRCHEFRGEFAGQVLFWDNEGLFGIQHGQKTFDPFYEAFVKLNMHLFGDGADKSLLKRHYSNSSLVDNAVKQVVDTLILPAQINPTTPLFKKERWPEMAYEFARIIAPLLTSIPRARLSAFSGKQGGEGKESAGNGIEQKLGTREGAEEVAYGRYAENDKPSPHFTNYEQLDSLYQRLARSIPVSVEAKTREQSLNISPLTYRPFDPERDDLHRIKASKLFVTDEGIAFGYQRFPLTIAARSKVQHQGFPDFKLIVLDNSSSMKEAPDGSDNTGNKSFIPWGDRSKYHFALLGLYGIEQFLQNQAIAQYIQHGVSLFSSTTRYKEASFEKLAEVRKHALSPEWGYTRVDASALIQTIQGRESFILSLSDGNLDNWDSEKAAFKQCIENNHYAHIQLGSKTSFTTDLESWGVPVFYVTQGEDLSRLMVDVTKQAYRRYVHQ